MDTATVVGMLKVMDKGKDMDIGVPVGVGLVERMSSGLFACNIV